MMYALEALGDAKLARPDRIMLISPMIGITSFAGLRQGGLAPVITFQSALDFTVHTRAIVNALYAQLPANGSELVLFDINRAALLSPLLRSSMDTILERMLPEPPRNFRTTIITNGGPNASEEVERVTEAGQVADTTRPLGLFYPADVFSLSHVALPFPPSDSLCGLQPDNSEDFGIHPGAMSGRRGADQVKRPGPLPIAHAGPTAGGCPSQA